MHQKIYRPDIDGLRAIAVLAVMAFHAFPNRFPGGFIGVDVFFVISGYLITQIIISSLNAGTFSFSDFYARRIRRIFPALILVLLSTLVFGWFTLFADEYKQLSKHVISGSASVANLVLWSEAGYFDNASYTKPLLHLWSLGVEEQFYLIWPAALILLWRRRVNLSLVAGLIGVASFGASLYLSYHSPIAGFYSPAARMWELMVGCFLAIHQSRSSVTARPLVANMIAIIGAGMLIISMFLTRNTMVFPGWIAILPMGTALMIWAGPGTLVGYMLSMRPLVFIGLISYPLYLWHWPLLSFAQILTGNVLRASVAALLLCAAFILAILTYFLAEKRLRRGGGLFIKTGGLVAALLIVVTGASAVFVTGGADRRALAQAGQFLSDAKSDWSYDATGFDNGAITGIHTLNGLSSASAIFIGDSLMGQFYPRLRMLYAQETPLLTATYISRNHCTPIPNTGRRSGSVACDDYYRAAMKMAQGSDFRRVVLAGSWEGAAAYLQGPQYQPFVNDLRELVLSGKDVVIVLMAPHSSLFDPTVQGATYRNLFKRMHAGPLFIDRAVLEPQDALSSRLLRRIARESGARVVNPYDAICPDNKCPIVFEGKSTHTDDYHMTTSGSAALASFMDDLVRNP
ncbi:acyltransferase family protein [Herbaspirillum seropedicae]|uniref:acyltransferase family protein n=1 Tax=Herbaspirillum seropedicae TaxID=964 RepID=UPI003FCC8808